MAGAAQVVRALVILLAVSQELFTSMNQALVGAMAGTDMARGRQTVHRDTLYGILRDWTISPITGFALSFLLYRLPAATIGERGREVQLLYQVIMSAIPRLHPMDALRRGR